MTKVAPLRAVQPCHFRSEFRYGSFTRSLPLPPHADEDDVTATYHDGILTISVGLQGEKKESVKKIEVKAVK